GPADGSILVLDTLGELAWAYAAATVAVVGGSLTPRGAGHSLAEPAAHGRPIVTGPFTDSQSEMGAAFPDGQAVVECPAEERTAPLARPLRDGELREHLGARARRVLGANSGATDRTLEALRPLLTASAQGFQRRSYSRLKLWLKRLALSPAGQALLAGRTRRLRSWPALRERWGEPDTILCLGNGPSSEDPRLCGLRFDRLFRVNWRWVGRGFLDRPDVIITGDSRTLRHAPRAVLGFRTV